MQNLLNELTDLLSKDERLVVEGKLLKNKIIELALAMDTELIKMLLKNKSIKEHFFKDVEGVLVFDKIQFQKFVSNKEFLPDSYTAFKNKIGLVNDRGDYITDSREVVLAWPYKDCVLEGGQTKEDQKRDEIFWNETLAPDEIDRLLAPKVFTNFKRYNNELKQIFNFDIIKYEKELNDINNLDKLYTENIMNYPINGSLNERYKNIIKTDDLKKQMTEKIEIFLKKIPFNIIKELDFYSSYNNAYDFSVLIIDENITKNIVTDFGITYI